MFARQGTYRPYRASLSAPLGLPAAVGSAGGGFGSSGKVRTDFGGADSVSALAIQRDGKIVAVGAGKGDFALARYLPDGRLDPSFGSGGTVRTDFGGKDSAFAVVIDGDGRILVGGTGKRQFALARYQGDGSLDPSFGEGGKVVTTFPVLPHDSMGTAAGATAVGLQTDGRIVAAGWSRVDAALTRYTPDGRVDPSFGKDGQVVMHPNDPWYADWIWTAAAEMQSDGKIVAGLVLEPHRGTLLVRFTRDGGLDAGFGRRGAVRNWGGSIDSGSGGSIAIQRNGKIVAGGRNETHGGGIAGYRQDFLLERYSRAGRLDNAFGRDGSVVTGFGKGQFTSVYDIAIQPDGKIVAVGSEFRVARYLPTGRLDTRFGMNGKVLTGGGSASAVAVQPDGKIVVAGQTASGHDFLLIRYWSNGRLDT